MIKTIIIVVNQLKTVVQIIQKKTVKDVNTQEKERIMALRNNDMQVRSSNHISSMNSSSRSCYNYSYRKNDNRLMKN